MPCFADQSPTYQPAMRLITAITQANPAQVTTSFAHNYITGEIVRLIIPRTFGMHEANQLKGEITVVDDTNFTILIDTIAFSPFSEPANNTQCAQCIPVGERNSLLRGATQNVLRTPR